MSREVHGVCSRNTKKHLPVFYYSHVKSSIRSTLESPAMTHENPIYARSSAWRLPWPQKASIIWLLGYFTYSIPTMQPKRGTSSRSGSRTPRTCNRNTFPSHHSEEVTFSVEHTLYAASQTPFAGTRSWWTRSIKALLECGKVNTKLLLLWLNE